MADWHEPVRSYSSGSRWGYDDMEDEGGMEKRFGKETAPTTRKVRSDIMARELCRRDIPKLPHWDLEDLETATRGLAFRVIKLIDGGEYHGNSELQF